MYEKQSFDDIKDIHEVLMSELVIRFSSGILLTTLLNLGNPILVRMSPVGRRRPEMKRE